MVNGFSISLIDQKVSAGKDNKTIRTRECGGTSNGDWTPDDIARRGVEVVNLQRGIKSAVAGKYVKITAMKRKPSNSNIWPRIGQRRSTIMSARSLRPIRADVYRIRCIVGPNDFRIEYLTSLDGNCAPIKASPAVRYERIEQSACTEVVGLNRPA